MISWHRFYDPTTGRYITADPIGLAGGINLYAYVGANPVNLMDPMGLMMGLHTCPYGDKCPHHNKPGETHWSQFEDYFNDPTKWWNAPTGSLDLGQVLGWSTCVTVCMLRQYPELFLEAGAEYVVIETMAFVAAPELAWIVLLANYGSTANTTYNIYDALQGCMRECCEILE